MEGGEFTEGSWCAAAAPAGLGAPAPGALWPLAWLKEVPAWALVEAALPASTSVCPSLPPLESQPMLSRQANACRQGHASSSRPIIAASLNWRHIKS